MLVGMRPAGHREFPRCIILASWLIYFRVTHHPIFQTPSQATAGILYAGINIFIASQTWCRVNNCTGSYKKRLTTIKSELQCDICTRPPLGGAGGRRKNNFRFLFLPRPLFCTSSQPGLLECGGHRPYLRPLIPTRLQDHRETSPSSLPSDHLGRIKFEDTLKSSPAQ